MPKPLPPHPNVRNCTHIKVTGQRCGSPALRGEFFCYFHTRVIKGVQQRVDMRLDSMALLEDCESIQLSIMHVVDGLVKGTIEVPRARLILEALRIAARNAKNVRFDDCLYRPTEQPMVRQVPDYARQYLIEHPEFGPPLSHCGAGAPAREAEANPSTCGADTPVREAETNAAAQRQTPAEPTATQQNASPETAIDQPAAERRQNAAHGASRGSATENDPAPQERKKPERELQEEESELKRVQAAIAGAERGNWRDLRTVFEFAGISEQNKDAPS
jgi:hypothetical protein